MYFGTSISFQTISHNRNRPQATLKQKSNTTKFKIVTFQSILYQKYNTSYLQSLHRLNSKLNQNTIQKHQCYLNLNKFRNTKSFVIVMELCNSGTDLTCTPQYNVTRYNLNNIDNLILKRPKCRSFKAVYSMEMFRNCDFSLWNF